MKLECNAVIADRTIALLQEAGRQHSERVVLWLAPASRRSIAPISEAYLPDQVASEDFFRIPPDSMKAMMVHLRANRLMVAAQVHSHPELAFHSLADDRWAVVRHTGALSLVVPYFAAYATAENLVQSGALFMLSPESKWLQVPAKSLRDHLEVVGVKS